MASRATQSPGQGHTVPQTASARVAPTFLPITSRVTIHYTRAALIQPLMLEDGIQVLVSPLSLEPHVLDEVTFAAQAQALKQCHRCCIFTIGNRDHTMQLQRSEGVVEDT